MELLPENESVFDLLRKELNPLLLETLRRPFLTHEFIHVISPYKLANAKNEFVRPIPLYVFKEPEALRYRTHWLLVDYPSRIKGDIVHPDLAIDIDSVGKRLHTQKKYKHLLALDTLNNNNT